MSKPWTPLTAAHIAAVPGQLGVFEIAGEDRSVRRLGYAGGREPFGLRSALEAAMAAVEDPAEPRYFRVELTHAYLTRWEELLMVHQAVNGELPPDNRPDGPTAVPDPSRRYDPQKPHRLGRLTLD